MKINTNCNAETDFGFFANHIVAKPTGAHQTISQTPRLKASTFKSPILGAINEPPKRANSLLDQDDHDLAFLNTAGLQDQDELAPGKLEVSDDVNELEMDFGRDDNQGLANFQDNQYNAQDQLGLGEPLEAADNFPYGRHRSSTNVVSFAQSTSMPLFNGLGANTNASRPREQQRPRNSFDMNECGLEMIQPGLNYMQKDRYEVNEHPADLRNSRYGPAF